MPFFQKHINAFDSDLWRDDDQKRNVLVKYVIKSNMLMGKTRDDVKRILGQEDNYFPFDRWTYYIGKGLLGNRYMVLYFNENKVTKVRTEFRK